jgi:thioredoxin reductase (NADPH)
VSAVPDILENRRDQAYPRLSAAQIARLAPHGDRMRCQAGQVLVEPGDRNTRLMVVLSGALEVVRTGGGNLELIVVYAPGQFAGEISTLRGAGALVRVRARESGDLLALDIDRLRSVIQSDSELSELFMRAFILRRMGLISSQPGDVILIGSRHSAGTLSLQQFLSRNGFPYVSLDVESDEPVQELLDRFHVSVDDVPVVLCRGQVLRNPSSAEVAKCLGMNPVIDESRLRDLVVIGAGPAGLAAAVYAASEGLDVLVVESTSPGGQAGASSRIENYLGFPTGISGDALTGRALAQAQKFGADIVVASDAVRLDCRERPYEVATSGEFDVRARAIIIASGARYRTLACEGTERFLGAGVYYAATSIEAKLCGGEEVVVVGGGNSAGQAAVFLASFTRHVHVLVRSAGLSETMSRYLIRRIEESPNITLHPHTEITALEGDSALERVTWRSADASGDETHDISHVFLMLGATPNSAWLKDRVALDANGFVRAGRELRADDLAAQSGPSCERHMPSKPASRESSRWVMCA